MSDYNKLVEALEDIAGDVIGLPGASDAVEEALTRARRLIEERDRLEEAIRLTVEEYPGYEEMDRIAVAIGLPGYLERR